MRRTQVIMDVAPGWRGGLRSQTLGWFGLITLGGPAQHFFEGHFLAVKEYACAIDFACHPGGPEKSPYQ